MKKKCIKCKKVKQLTEYYICSGYHQSQCKMCFKKHCAAYMRIRRETNPKFKKAHNEANRKWKLNNPERYAELCKAANQRFAERLKNNPKLLELKRKAAREGYHRRKAQKKKR